MEFSVWTLWAKSDPYQPLWQHMLNVGLVAQVLLKKTHFRIVLEKLSCWLGTTEEDTLHLASYIAALHDIGKCHPVFQAQDAKMKQTLREAGLYQTMPLGMHFRHEKYTEEVLYRLLPKRLPKKLAIQLSRVTGLHHQGKQGASMRLKNKLFFEAQQEKLEEICYGQFPFSSNIGTTQAFPVDIFCTLLLGVVILADWIASGQMKTAADPTESVAAYVVYAANAAETAVAACGFLEPQGLEWAKDYTDYWPEFTKLRPVQEAVAAISLKNPQLAILEAPMGEGKTEAAIFLASRLGAGKRGLYFGLPTAATSNQMYVRLLELFHRVGKGRVRLLHSTAWLVDQTSFTWGDAADLVEAAQWLRPLKRGLLEQNAVGTIDQAMLSVLSVKYGVLCLLGLVGKVLILDEVHAYDMYMNTILERLLNWCAALEVPVVLLSATLPKKRREALVTAYTGKNFISQETAYPLITTAEDGLVQESPGGEAFMKRTLSIQRLPFLGNPAAMADYALWKTQGGGCLCLIVNTVDMAQKVYQAIQEKKEPDVWLRVLHARFPAGKRAEIEEECAKCFGKRGALRPQRAILVATQILEQSCDYSFDYMASELAPIDLLLQRSGRLLRHPGVGLYGQVPHKLTVFTPEGEDFGPSQFVYYPFLLKQTQHYLDRIADIEIPGGIRDAIESVYGSEPDEKDMQDWLERAFGEELQAAQAESVLLKPPDPKYFGLWERAQPFERDESETLSMATRLGEPSRRVLLLSASKMPSQEAMRHLSLETMQELFLCGVTLRESQLIWEPAMDYQAPVMGQGRLAGCLIYPLVDGQYEGRERRGNKMRYLLDDELGLVIERGNGNGF